MPREFRHRRRVQFYETDLAGIVHFSWYFRYMEEAEHALWRDAGLSVASRGADVGFPRVSVGFDYHRPLHFEDEFEVRVRIVGMTAKSFRYHCLIMRGDTKIATGTLVTVCVRKDPGGTMKAVPIPAEIAARFAVAAEPGA